MLSRRFVQIRVKSITGRWHALSCKGSDTVGSIKAEIRSKEGPGDYRGKGLMFVHDSPEWQNVVHKGEILRDSQSLQSAGIVNDSVLHVVRKRRLVPQAKESCGHCLESPCVHKEAEHQYAPDMHWSNAYGWSFPGERNYESQELLAPEFELKMPPGGLKAQRLRTGPQHHRGDVTLVMQSEEELRDSKEMDLRASEGSEADDQPGESMEMSSLLSNPEEPSSKVDPIEEDEQLQLERTQSELEELSESDYEEAKRQEAQRSRCCRPKKWCRQYCHEVGLGFKQVMSGWCSVFLRPSESEFEPSEDFQAALEGTIDQETCLNLSYQGLGDPYQWQYFVKMVPCFELLRELNLSNNQLTALPGFDMPLLERLSLAYNLLDDLSGIPPMSELRVLDLTGNNLDTAAGIYNFQKLERLTLRDNPIEYKYMYEDRVKARAPASLLWLDGKPFEAGGWNLQYLIKLMFQSEAEDRF